MQNGYTNTGHTEKIWMLVHLTDEKSIQKSETKTSPVQLISKLESLMNQNQEFTIHVIPKSHTTSWKRVESISLCCVIKIES